MQTEPNLNSEELKHKKPGKNRKHRKPKNFWKRPAFFRRWGISFLFLFLIIAVSCLLSNLGGGLSPVYNTQDWQDEDSGLPYLSLYKPQINHTQWNILLDGHSHTRYSDGSLTPEQNLLWHLSMGYNAMILTDHNTFKGVEEIRTLARTKYNDSIKVLIGTEWTTRRIHLNLILPPNATDYSQLTPPGWSVSDAEIQAVIHDTHQLGGLVVVNHYPWSETHCENQPSREELLAWGVDYFEVINEDIYDNQSIQFSLENNLGQITGSDMHQPEEVFSATLLNISELTEQAIFNSLKARQTSIFYNSSGSGYHIDHQTKPTFWGTFLAPFISLGEAATPLFWPDPAWPSIIAWMFWYHLMFFFIEFLIFIPGRGKKKRKIKETHEGNGKQENSEI